MGWHAETVDTEIRPDPDVTGQEGWLYVYVRVSDESGTVALLDLIKAKGARIYDVHEAEDGQHYGQIRSDGTYWWLNVRTDDGRTVSRRDGEYLSRADALGALLTLHGDVSHVNYPHEPGRLYDCAACEYGPCACDSTTAPCVSVHCVQGDDS